MIKHIVMWKFKDEAEGKTRKENVEFVKSSLLKLPAIISEIKFMEVHEDESGSDANFDAVLVTEFESFEALNTYKVHPEHQKISKYVALVSCNRSAVDYNL